MQRWRRQIKFRRARGDMDFVVGGSMIADGAVRATGGNRLIN